MKLAGGLKHDTRPSRGLKRARGHKANFITGDQISVQKEAIDGWQEMSKKQLKRAIRVTKSNKIRAIKSERREANMIDEKDVLYHRQPGDLRVGLPANFDPQPFRAILELPAEQRSIKLNASARTRVRMAEAMNTAPAVLLDCCAQYTEWMKFSERSSVALQVMHTYSSNRQADKPIWWGVSGMAPEWEGLLFDLGGHGWALHSNRAELTPGFTPAQLGSRKLVYLSADSDTILEGVHADTAYIVGGLVDRNRHKGAAAARAAALGIPTARLPLQENLGLSDATVLTCLHVVQLLLRVWNGATWGEACVQTLPQRKIQHKLPRADGGSTAKEVDVQGPIIGDEAVVSSVEGGVAAAAESGGSSS
jgi:tRNA (guanine9-N1)-methyltransferase